MKDLHGEYCDCLGCSRQVSRMTTLENLLSQCESALENHVCPEDGSTDTVCYPDNHKCPARKTLKAIKKLKLL